MRQIHRFVLTLCLLFTFSNQAQAGLVERLMHDTSVPENTWIEVHFFFAAVNEIAYGALTGAQVKTFLNITGGQDLTDWDQLAAQMPGADAAKAMFMNRVHGVFILAEKRPPTYSTPAEVRTKLGITP